MKSSGSPSSSGTVNHKGVVWLLLSTLLLDAAHNECTVASTSRIFMLLNEAMVHDFRARTYLSQ